MKKVMLILSAISVSFFSCESEDDTKFQVSAELKPYVDQFYAAAEARGVDVDKNLIAGLRTTQTAIYTGTEGDQKVLYFHPVNFQQANDSQREAQIFFHLGKMFLSRTNLFDITKPAQEQEYSFMNSALWGGYNPADKDMLLDELFEND